MTSVQFLFPENRLAKLVRQPGGIGLQQAIAAASSNLESIRDELLVGLDEYLQQVDAIGADPRLPEDRAMQEDLYQKSNFVAGVAGHCGLAELGQAAYTFCEVLDRFLSGAAWSAPAVMVHLDALKVLRATDPSAANQNGAAVVQGLRKVTERIVRPTEK